MIATFVWIDMMRSAPALPDVEGFSGMIAGVSRGRLIAAGGAKFANKKPWDGGKKVWYDDVYALRPGESKWRPVGKLPRRLAYAVSASDVGSIVVVGGSDSDRHYPDAFRMDVTDTDVQTRPLPPLPIPLANASGAIVSRSIYVVGGQESPTSVVASKRVFRLDLSRATATWQEIPPLPGPGRILATTAHVQGALIVIGGAELTKSGRRYLADAYRYQPVRGWTKLGDAPHAIVGAPNPAPSSGSMLTVLGGDDGSTANVKPSLSHPGFNHEVWRFDVATGFWMRVGDWSSPRVTAPCVQWLGRWFVVSGEIRPGVHSPETSSTTAN